MGPSGSGLGTSACEGYEYQYVPVTNVDDVSLIGVLLVVPGERRCAKPSLTQLTSFLRGARRSLSMIRRMFDEE